MKDSFKTLHVAPFLESIPEPGGQDRLAVAQCSHVGYKASPWPAHQDEETCSPSPRPETNRHARNNILVSRQTSVFAADCRGQPLQPSSTNVEQRPKQGWPVALQGETPSAAG